MKTTFSTFFISTPNELYWKNIMKIVNRWKEVIGNDGTNVDEEILIKHRYFW